MEGFLAEELYSESLQSTKSRLGDTSSSDYRKNWSSGFGADDSCEDDGSLWGGSDEGLKEISDLDREWQRRHDQFHTIGYRDGLIAGKEAAAQEGFNVGFKQSVSVGFNLGLVRGVSSVLASLPGDLKEKLMGVEENKGRFQSLYVSVNSLSTAGALRLFNDDVMAQGTKEECRCNYKFRNNGFSEAQFRSWSSRKVLWRASRTFTQITCSEGSSTQRSADFSVTPH